MSLKIEILLQDSRTNLIIITQTPTFIQIYFHLPIVINCKQKNIDLHTFKEKDSLISLYPATKQH